MADDGSDNVRKLPDLPIRIYVAAILDGFPEISSLYESVRDHATQRSVSTPIVPEQTQRPEPSEVEKKGKEIVVYAEPIEHEHSDERDMSSQDDTAKVSIEISDDDDDDMSRTIPVKRKKVLLSKIMKNSQSSENKSGKSLIQKVNPGKHGNSEPRPVAAKPLIREYSVDDIERLFEARKGLQSRSVFNGVGNMEKNKAVQVEDPARRLSGAPKELKSRAEENGSFRRVEKPVFYGSVDGSGPSGSVVDQPGEAIKKNCV